MHATCNCHVSVVNGDNSSNMLGVVLVMLVCRRDEADSKIYRNRSDPPLLKAQRS